MIGGGSSSNMIAAGENLVLNYAVFNRSSATIREVVVSLIEECSYSAQGRRRLATTTLATRTIVNNPDAVNDLSPQKDNAEVSEFEYFQRMQTLLGDQGIADLFACCTRCFIVVYTFVQAMRLVLRFRYPVRRR